MVRTLKFALRRDPATSRAIASLATQQNAAYNKAVSILNREPSLPKRSGKDHPDALNKRITTWRKTNRLKTQAPYNVHQVGAEQAWEANQLLQKHRAERAESPQLALPSRCKYNASQITPRLPCVGSEKPRYNAVIHIQPDQADNRAGRETNSTRAARRR